MPGQFKRLRFLNVIVLEMAHSTSLPAPGLMALLTALKDQELDLSAGWAP